MWILEEKYWIVKASLQLHVGLKYIKKVPAHSTEKFRTSQGAVNRESKLIETVFRQLSVDRRVALRVAPQ